MNAPVRQSATAAEIAATIAASAAVSEAASASRSSSAGEGLGMSEKYCHNGGWPTPRGVQRREPTPLGADMSSSGFFCASARSTATTGDDLRPQSATGPTGVQERDDGAMEPSLESMFAGAAMDSSAFRCSAATSALQPRARARSPRDGRHHRSASLREDSNATHSVDSFTSTTEPERGPRFATSVRLDDEFTQRPARRPETSVQHFRE
jgi:hypothetical protein